MAKKKITEPGKMTHRGDEDPRAVIFKALASPKRIYILELLRERELCGGEFIDLLKVKQSAVSRHLSILHRAGLIRKRKSQSNIYYTLSSDRVPALLEIASELVRQHTDRVRRILES